MTQEAISCTQPTCRCECFSPGKSFLRTCDTCKHGWVSHALEKLGYRTMHQLGMQVEIVQPNIVFDIASLILYGAQAAPIRLKILLDRLFSVLQHDEVLQVLHGFGWSYEDYARGYILQDPSGRVLDKWIVTTREEEQVILQQFLRFGETKSIAQEIILQDARDNREKQNFQMSPKSESEIKKFIERSNIGMQSFMRGYDPRGGVLTKQVPFPMSAGASAAAAVAARMLTPPVVPNFPSPGSTARDRGGMLLPVSPSNNPLAGSPLTRLQTMQPVDYRRDPVSPSASPAASDKLVKTEHRSPQNLSVGAITPQNVSIGSTTPSSISSLHSAMSPMMFTPVTTPIKAEMPPSNPSSAVKQDSSAMDGVLNFSLKDQNSLAHTPPRQLQSPIAQVSPASHAQRSPGSMGSSSSHYADQKIKHLRKSSNPMKRPWQPTPGYGGTLISPSGKKRVLCTACNKTFCDKGALKIHYSAVHLKEMHKCSVDGCNMMFSSRRSRNRHSANPNPKLHMPQARRKLPDGAVPGMMDDIGSDDSSPPIHMAPVMPGLLTPSPQPPMDVSEVPIPMPRLSAPVERSPEVEPPAQHTSPHGVPTGTNAAGQVIYYLDPSALAGIPPQLLPNPPKAPTGDDVSSDQASKDDENASKGRSSSKRKRLIPTRVTQMDESFVLSDENSNDGIAVLDDDDDDADDMARHLRKSQKCDSSSNNCDGSSRNESSDEEGIAFDTDSDGNAAEMVSSGDEGMSSISCNSPLKPVKLDPNPDILPIPPRICSPKDQSAEPCNDSVRSDVANMDDVEPATNNIEAKEAEEEEDLEENGQEKDEDMDIEGLDDIPLDKDNPKKCQVCGKVFLNLFTVKMHYQNVHLKLMHKCSVDGCNAAFPSKRSRDRHSSNINLHRKLLSTSSSDSEMNSRNLSLREEFLPRIYDNQHFSGAFIANHSENGLNGMEANNNDSRNALGDDDTPMVNGKDSLYEDRESDDDSGVDQQDGDSDDTEVYNNQILCNGEIELNGKDVGPEPDPNGSASCHVCSKVYRDNLILKEHFELNHPKEMYRCSIQGCDKIFSTRKSRNRHSQNDNLHRHLSPTDINGDL